MSEKAIVLALEGMFVGVTPESVGLFLERQMHLAIWRMFFLKQKLSQKNLLVALSSYLENAPIERPSCKNVLGLRIFEDFVKTNTNFTIEQAVNGVTAYFFDTIFKKFVQNEVFDLS